jgi:hypothetical protein
VNLVGEENGREMSQQFADAVFARSVRGNYDIVLVDQTEGLSRTMKGSNKPLQTSDAAPLTHLLQIRVLWTPTRTIRPGAPSASNATVHWTVLSRDGRLDYTGAGFAQVYGRPEDEKINVRLRGIRLTPAGKTGDLDDPIGPATLTASFKARSDAATVHTAEAMINNTAQSADASAPIGGTPAPSYPGPPARSPGP